MDKVGENKLDYETVELIGTLTNSQKLIEKVNQEKKNHENINKKTEDKKVCLAIEEMYQDGVRDGKIEGRLEGKIENEKTNLISIMDYFQIDLEKAMDILKIPKEERERIRINF